MNAHPIATAAPDIDPWYRQRGLPSDARRVDWPTPWMMAACGVIAVALLAGFYMVLNQAVSRAHEHWAAAPAPVVSLAAEDCGAVAPVSSCLRVDTTGAPGLVATAYLSPSR